MADITALLEKNQGEIVNLVFWGTQQQGLLLRDEREGQSDGLHGWKIITKGSIPGWYSRVYFGLRICEVRGEGVGVVIALDRDKKYDIGVGPKPAYNCPLRTDIEALETALEGTGK